MSNLRTTIKSSPPGKKSRASWLLFAGSVFLFGLVILAAKLSSTGNHAVDDGGKPAASVADHESAQNGSETPSEENELGQGSDSSTTEAVLVDDDGKTLWASPTHGGPIDVSYLSPGAQIVLAMRPKELMQSAEGPKMLASLGPTGDQAVAALEGISHVPFADIERLTVGWEATSDRRWHVGLVIRTTEPIAKRAMSELKDAKELEHEGQKYLEVGERAIFAPAGENDKVLVIATSSSIVDVIDLGSDPPPLRRDVERLIAHTDAELDVTILFTPNSLFSEGRSIFAGEMSRLQQPLFWFLGDELSAAALSLDWGDNFYAELIATPTLDTSPERAAAILAERVAQLPNQVESYVVGLDAQPYGRMVVSRFPAMIRKLSAHTRSGFEPDFAMLNAYLPVVAGHNLLMGAELMLAEAPGGKNTVAEATAPSEEEGDQTRNAPLTEKLKRVTSLKFAKDTLEAALEQLSQDIDVPIVIRGPDLQADGITKNQSFGIDVERKPAGEVLVAILRLANPDKTATAANDEKQKLVYVIGKSDGGKEQIFVTTRAAAKARGEELPPVFQAEKP